MRIFFCFYLENSNILLYYDNIGLPQRRRSPVSTVTGFDELFSNEVQLNFEITFIFLTFAITNKKGYEKERNQMV